MVVPKLEETHVYKGVLDCKVMTYWEYPAPARENWYEVLHEMIKIYARIGIEDNVKTVKIEAKQLFPGQLVIEQRKIKSSYELDKIRQSAKFSDKAMKKIFQSVYQGASVIEPFALSKNIQTELIRAKQFDPITTSLLIAVWPALISAMPHTQCSRFTG